MRRPVYHGKWYTPEDPNHEYPGTLEVSDNNTATLTLYESMLERRFVVPIILGRALGGQPITLIDCYGTGSLSSPSSDMSVSNYSPMRVLVGAGFSRKEDMRFRQASCQFRNFREWLGPSGLRWSGDKAEYVQHEPIVVSLKHAQLSMACGLFTSMGRFEVGLEEKAMISISTNEPLSLGEWHDKYLHPLVNFLTLATGRASNLTNLQFWIPRVQSKEPADVGIEVIEKYYSGSANERDSVGAHDMYFTYRDIQGQWSSLIRNWFDVCEVAGEPINLFFSTAYKPSMYIEQSFGSVIQSLEAFHRRTTPNMELPEADHEKRLSAILESTPEALRDWLQQRLSFSNEPSLKKRLEELVGAARVVVEPFLRNTSKFIRKVIDTRNFLVHRNPDLRDRAVAPEDLWEYTFVLSLVMRAALLRKVITDPDRANVLTTTTPEYHFQSRRIKLP